VEDDAKVGSFFCLSAQREKESASGKRDGCSKYLLVSLQLVLANCFALCESFGKVRKEAR